MPQRKGLRSYLTKRNLLYFAGLILLLSGLGGIANGGLGILGGPILIATSLLLMPATREPFINGIESVGGPDLSTLSRGAFSILLIAGFVIGVGLMPTDTTTESPTIDAATPEDPDPSDSTSPSNSSDEPGSSTDSSSDDRDSSNTSDSGENNTTDPPDDSDGTPKTSWTVTLVSVTDGDTMDVRMPNGSMETIRLLGVDTPETSAGQTDPAEWDSIPDNSDGRAWLERWGSEATAFAQERLGDEIYIEVDPAADRRGTYDRLLVYAYQEEEADKSFNLQLIENGYARMYDSEFSERSVYSQAESDAITSEIGVWDYTDDSDSGGGSSGELVVSTIQADAPGNDHENLNGEYITLTNNGESTVDLSDWTVSDAADHTFYFPSGYQLGAGSSVTIYTGSGSNTASELYWGSSNAVWNNGGDTIIVSSDSGETVINREYGG